MSNLNNVTEHLNNIQVFKHELEYVVRVQFIVYRQQPSAIPQIGVPINFKNVWIRPFQIFITKRLNRYYLHSVKVHLCQRQVVSLKELTYFFSVLSSSLFNGLSLVNNTKMRCQGC